MLCEREMFVCDKVLFVWAVAAVAGRLLAKPEAELFRKPEEEVPRAYFVTFA